MKEYSFSYQTPMKWHKFLTYFCLPLSFLSTLVMLPSIMKNADLLKFTEYHLLGEVETVIYVAYLFISARAFIGLLKRRWFGPCLLFAAYATTGIYGIFLLLVGNLWIGNALLLSRGFSQAIVSFVFLALNVLYYNNRRMLFSGGNAAPETAPPASPASAAVQTPPPPSAAPAQAPVSAPSFYLPREVPAAPPAAEPVPSPADVKDRLSDAPSHNSDTALGPVPAPSPAQEAPAPQSLSAQRPRPGLRKGVVAAACCVLVVMAGALGFLAWNTYTLTQRLEDAALEQQALSAQIDSLEADLSFYTSKIGFVVEDSDHYHTRDCYVYKQADSFWAYNIEYCAYLGYTPCPICWPQ